MAKVTMSPGWEKALEKQVKASPQFKKIEADLNAKVQTQFREVNAQMQGGDVEQIVATLTSRLTALNVRPNPAQVRAQAEQIANGTFE